MPTASYDAFGLTWQMPLLCPELRPDQNLATWGASDIVAHYGAVPPASVLPSLNGESCAKSAVTPSQDITISWGGVARLCVRGGAQIIVDRAPGVSDDAVRALLLGAGAASVLHQRGRLPLHASAITAPAGAVLFMGHSGAGKSTLLGAFRRRGYPMLAEDLAAVRLDDAGRPWVAPGVVVTKLRADSAAYLCQPTSELRYAGLDEDKFVVPVTGPLASAAVPLLAIYALSVYDGSALQFERQRDSAKFHALVDHTWLKFDLPTFGLHAQHFSLAARVAAQIPITRVRRPQGVFCVDEIADWIAADLAHSLGSV